MRSIKTFFLILSIGLFTACEDDDDGTIPQLNPCGGDIQFCMDYDGSTLSGDAEMEPLDVNRFRINFTHSSGNFEEVQIDIYGRAISRYQVNTTGNPGTASFTFYTDSLEGTRHGVGGFVDLLSLRTDEESITGSFEITLEDSTQVTNGNFVDVPNRH